MKGNGKMKIEMAMVDIFLVMEDSILDSGKIIRDIDKECCSMLMELLCMKENGRMMNLLNDLLF